MRREERAAAACEQRYAQACAVLFVDVGTPRDQQRSAKGSNKIGYACVTDGRITGQGTVGSLDLLPVADAAVIEEPVIYPDPRKQKGDPNIIRKLYGLAIRIGEQYPEYLLVPPRTWNRGAPKHVVNNWVKQSLLPGETLGASQHARDAQGLACWLLRRPMWTNARQ